MAFLLSPQYWITHAQVVKVSKRMAFMLEDQAITSFVNMMKLS